MVEPMFIAKLSQSVVKGQIVELTGPEAKHAVSVRRMRVGEPIQLTDTLGLRVRGNVHGISGNTMQVEVEWAETDSVPDLKFTLVQALAKGDRDELAIQAAFAPLALVLSDAKIQRLVINTKSVFTLSPNQT
jgi:16S rRNA (uracil1498-N3)-methyltransferase